MKFDDYAISLGFTKNKNVYTLEVNDFKLYLKNYQYMILAIPSIFIPLNKPLNKEDIKDLQIAAYANACFMGKTSEAKDTLIVTLPEGNKQKEEKQKIIKEIITNVINILREKGYAPLNLCPICHKEASYDIFGDTYSPIHTECKNEYLNKLKDLSEKEKGFKPSYVLAVLLTILGTAIGLLPVILLAIFNHDYFTGLFALGPICGSLAQLLAKAPKKKTLAASLGAIILSLVIATLIFTIIYIPNAKNISIQDYIINDGAQGLRKIIFGSLLSFAGFGILRFLSKFKINYTEELKKFEE